MRLVSRRFNDIATPIIYRSLALNQRLVALDAEIQYPNALHHIAVYTNHVVVSSNLDREGVTRILTRVRRLSSVRFVNISVLGLILTNMLILVGYLLGMSLILQIYGALQMS